MLHLAQWKTSFSTDRPKSPHTGHFPEPKFTNIIFLLPHVSGHGFHGRGRALATAYLPSLQRVSLPFLRPFSSRQPSPLLSPRQPSSQLPSFSSRPCSPLFPWPASWPA